MNEVEIMKVKHDRENKRFYVDLKKGAARLEYKSREGYLDFYETYVSRDLRGRGIASKIMVAALNYVRDNNLKAKASCPYLNFFFKRHKEYKNIEKK